jgi:hypothetical protein
MTQGRKIAMLGLPAENFGIGWAHLVTNMITIKGIYRHQIVRDLVRDVGTGLFGPRHLPGHHAQVRCRRFRGVLANMHSAPCGKVSSPGLTGKQRS